MNVTRFAQATKYGIDVDSGIPKGNMYHIACSAWFTSTGQTMPRYFKFEDDAGEVQTVKDILVKYTEEKNYSGIPSREYGCEAVIGGLIREFKLIFFPPHFIIYKISSTHKLLLTPASPIYKPPGKISV